MNMVPFYDMYGTILGHVDLDICQRTRFSVVVDNGPIDWSTVPIPTDQESTNVEMFHIPFREIKFRSRHADATVRHLVVEADTIPPWFWDSRAVVEFFPHSWKEVR